MFRFLPFLLLLSSPTTNSQPPLPSRCEERCGDIAIPFPFHLSPSCGLDTAPLNAPFRLSCRHSGAEGATNSSSSYTGPASLFLTLSPGSPDLHVLRFFPTGSLLVDLSSPNNTSSNASSLSPCAGSRPSYFRIDSTSSSNSSFPLGSPIPFFGASTDNVLRLYDCEDSSLCRADCGKAAGCNEGGSGGGFPGCCYPLSDSSVWEAGGGGFSVFAEFGCRGFSSWVARPDGTGGSDGGPPLVLPGLEIEWAIPRGVGNRSVCADGAVVVNSTAVPGGVRCTCAAGLVGDGFVEGVGCLTSCTKDGHLAYGDECDSTRPHRKKVALLAGVIVSVIVLVFLVVFWSIFKRRRKSADWAAPRACFPHMSSKFSRTRRFTYQELSKATGGFEENQKLVDDAGDTVHAGELHDGSLVAVQRISYPTAQLLSQALDRVDFLSHISHQNVARIVGCCVNMGNTLVVVHEFFSTATLEELLKRSRGNGLDWRKRMNIAMEVAGCLAYLQLNVHPPVCPHNLRSSDILVGVDYSTKITCYKLLSCRYAAECCLYAPRGGSNAAVVYNFGLALLEMIAGPKHDDFPKSVLAKISSGYLEKVVDPWLGFRNLLPRHKEQIEKVAALATQCLCCRDESTGSLCISDVARELVCIVRSISMDDDRRHLPRRELEVTFSNSSLLQMISMSPETKYVQ